MIVGHSPSLISGMSDDGNCHGPSGRYLSGAQAQRGVKKTRPVTCINSIGGIRGVRDIHVIKRYKGSKFIRGGCITGIKM